MSVEKLIKNAGKLVIGKREVLKSLKAGTIAEVYISQSCSDSMLAELSSAAKFSNAPVGRLDINSDELGIKLKKSFGISVAGIKK